ncbi:MAG: hypothetical protein AAGA20_17355, partial [Planctomycetota bacterium]
MIESNEYDAGAAVASRLDALEERLAEILGRSEDRDRRGRFDDLAGVEQDLLELECELGATSGSELHPALGVALGWEDRLRRAGCAEEAGAVERLSAGVVIRRLRERGRAALATLETPREQLEDAAKVTSGTFDTLLAAEELRGLVEGRASTLGTTDEVDARAVCEEVDQALPDLRRALLHAIGANAPDRRTRAEWTGRLVDFADETLLKTGEQPPRVCARMLGEAAGALRWHIEHVETGRTEERKRLVRRVRRLEAERVEQRLQSKLEATFGRRAVELWERAILVAIAAIVVLLFLDLTRGPAPWRLAVDTVICGFLLVDFFVKLAFVGVDGRWLARHFLTDFLPALPYGLFASLDGAASGTGQLARLLRLTRLARIATYLKVALPVIRTFRALGFLIRGVDRLFRRNASLFDREVLVFPTPRERRRAGAVGETIEARRWRLRGQVDGLYDQSLEATPEDERSALAAGRLGALEAAASLDFTRKVGGSAPGSRRSAIPLAERLLRRLATVRSQEVEARIGVEASRRIARGARLVARSPLRFVPVLGRWAPTDAADLPSRRLASRTIRSVARSLETLLGRVLWFADLRGTLTPSEVVGRVGATLVARTTRPAVRLLLFGGLYVLLQLVLGSPEAGDDVGIFRQAFDWLGKIVGDALKILGSICLVLLAIGAWLQRLARDTTTFHEQVARAQFLHLTESVKARQRMSDARLLARRVYRLERATRDGGDSSAAALHDERRFLEQLERFRLDGTPPPSSGASFDVVARSVLLYCDLLDGALLAHSDTRATSQLLGNLAVQRAARRSRRVGREVHASLRSIDLERRRTLVRGPYLWFHSISRALSSRAARLIVDYNAHAIPLAELDRIGDEERASYRRWLDRTELQADSDGDEEAMKAPGEAPQLTTAFTVLHFLDASDARDAEIEERFGPAVVARLRHDRRTLVRTVFGTYPFHRMPTESRVLSVRSLYADWIEGGRVLLLPFRFSLFAMRLALRGLRGIMHAVKAIRRPEIALREVRDAEADFAAAVRKIGRMRGPGALAALHLRAILDPEYHGLALPLLPAEEGAPDGRSSV